MRRKHDEPWAPGDADGAWPFQALFTGRQFPAVDGVKIEIGPAKDVRHKLTMSMCFAGRPGRKATAARCCRQILQGASARGAMGPPALQVAKGERVLPPLAGRQCPRLRGFAGAGAGEPCGWVPAVHYQRCVGAGLGQSGPGRRPSAPARPAHRGARAGGFGLCQRPWPPSAGRSAKVRLAGSPHPVPLSSMGDGIQRVLQLTLKLLAAKGGFCSLMSLKTACTTACKKNSGSSF